MSATAISASDEVEATDDMISIPLTAHDRCDSCGSQAYVRFVKDEQDFLFCGHHSTKYFKGLKDAGFEIIQDMRASLGGSRTQGSAN